MSNLKIALVHDDFCQQGGAESLFATIAQIYPNAPIYTSLVNWKKLPNSIEKKRIKTSFIQRIPFASRLYKPLFPLYSIAFESFDFSQFDIVISSTTRFAKSIITHPNTVHICYINSTPRFLWQENKDGIYYSKILSFVLRPVLNWLRRFDRASSSRVDHYIANSQNVASTIKEIYGYDSSILYPYADLDFFTPAKIHNWELKSQNYFLIVSRLVKWKDIDLAIRVCDKAGYKLKIVGSGPDFARLKKIAGDNIEFLGKVSIEQLKTLYQNSKGLVITQEEDFGISMVEAQACGIPVIAYTRGGQREIIADGKTGLFFEYKSQDSLKDALSRASNVKWKSEECSHNVRRFKRQEFVKGLMQIVTSYAKTI
jgi:glycosyltransferase involved in cell wall biosynthesis